jgi:Putative phage tail protein
MPSSLQFFDMSVSVTPPNGYLEPQPVTLGPNWQSGDIRLLFVSAYGTDVSGTTTTMSMTPDPPTGFFSAYSLNLGFETRGVYWSRLTPSSTDTSVAWTRPVGWRDFMFATVTVRGASPTVVPTAAALGVTYTTGVPSATVSSVSVPGAGTMVFFLGDIATPSQSAWPNWAVSLGVPPGWTNLVATNNSGATFYSYDTNPALIVVGKSYTSSGSTGTVSFPTAQGAPAFAGAYVFLTPAPDVSTTASPATESDTTVAATGSTTTTVVATARPATERDTVGTAFNPLQGYWISDALVLPGTPVTSSVVRWVATTPPGTSVTVATSINNGASWDTATNNALIPRLLEGDTTTVTVLTKITLTRASALGAAPEVSSLYVAVSTNTSTDELVPVAYGVIDKVTVHATAGTTGSGSTSGAVSSSAVISTGGGQTGGGTSITVHAVDLSLVVKRNVWQQPYTVASGLNYGAAAQAMVLNRAPSQTAFSLASTQEQTPLLVFGTTQGGDPWQDVRELAQAIGFECFFDPTGTFVFRPVPDPRYGIPVWTFDETANPTVSEAVRELGSDQTFNDIVVIGASTSSANAVSAEAFDNDPASHTYVLGPFGRVSQRLTFPQITTQSAAQAAANAALYNSLGGSDQVTITCVPMPALEPGDIVKINVSDVRVNGTYMINSMTTSLSPADPQELVCFRQSTSTTS